MHANHNQMRKIIAMLCFGVSLICPINTAYAQGMPVVLNDTCEDASGTGQIAGSISKAMAFLLSEASPPIATRRSTRSSTETSFRYAAATEIGSVLFTKGRMCRWFAGRWPLPQRLGVCPVR